jgi:hypothetical protein
MCQTIRGSDEKQYSERKALNALVLGQLSVHGMKGVKIP